MAAPLLATKLYIPRTRRSLVLRPHLLERLDEGLRRKLIVISAPAGFGKTTLVSTWLASRGLAAAWISLDEDDNDPARFLAYLVAGLRTCHEGIGQGILSSLESSQPPAPQAVLSELINEIAALRRNLVVVLDDYHLITSQPIHEAVGFLLEHLPEGMVVMIASRGDPPLALARLRGRGQMTELRQADLRFTAREAGEFLQRAMTLELSAEDVTALTSRTEGWITGLQMAALALQPPPGRTADLTERGQEAGRPSGFVQAFTGSNRYVLDYLVEEVLQRQPEAIQSFLLQSAVLDRLSSRLCDAVVETDTDGEVSPQAELALDPHGPVSRSQQILERLDSDNLFIIPLDDERRWYRYHRLFADLLRKRLRQTQPQLVPLLHRKASKWYEANGLMNEAIKHALAADEHERAADLIERAAEPALMRSEFATFLQWIDALPDALVRQHPTLCLYHALALLWGGRPVGDFESRLQDVDSAGDGIASRAATLRASAAIWQGQATRASGLAMEALDQLPSKETFLRAIAAWTLGLAHMLNGQIEAGIRAINEVVRMGKEQGNVMLAVTALSHLAELHMSGAQLGEAHKIYQEALELATDSQGRHLPVAGMPLIGLGEIQREWNKLDAAERLLGEGIECVQEWGAVGALDGYIALARVKQAQGDQPGAQQALDTAKQLAVEFDVTELDDQVVELHQTRLWILQGNLGAVRLWLEQRALLPSQVLWTPADTRANWQIRPELTKHDEEAEFLERRMRSYEYLLLARYLLALGRSEEALPLLEYQIEAARSRGRNRSRRMIEIWSQTAMAHGALGHADAALACLEEALEIAEPGRLVRIFADEGEAMAMLLRQAASSGIRPAYVGTLLADLKPAASEREAPVQQAGAPEWAPQPLVEPLTEREMDVLRLLAAGLSNPEIAEQLYIATSTVRSHLKSIYGKLGVHRRWDAVLRAQDLGLV